MSVIFRFSEKWKYGISTVLDKMVRDQVQLLMNMHKKFSLFLFFCIGSSAHAASDPLKQYSKLVQEGSAVMQVCGESFGQPYDGIPKILNEKYFHLLDLSGKKPRNASSHEKKIKYHVEKERKLQRTPQDCKSSLFRMKGFVSKMDKDIQDLESSAAAKP